MTPTIRWRPPQLTAQTDVVITARQADVLAGIAHGHTNKQIGARLGIVEESVKTHVKDLLRAVGARNRAHAAALACSGQVVVHVRGDRNPLATRTESDAA